MYVSRSLLEEWGALSHGFSSESVGVYDRIASNHAFDTRLELETDPLRKQIIPYVVVSDGSCIFVTARKSKQTEARLHGMLSIGAGGHVNEDDVRAENDTIFVGMMRELHEELRIVCSANPQFKGFLNDESNEVGRVHLGAVFFAIAERENVSVREVEKMDGFWMTLDELEQNQERLENWSRLVLPEVKSWLT